MNSSFDPAVHLSIGDIQADLLVNPACFKVHIKCSKTDPFRKGCDIYVGRGNSSVCPIVALSNHLVLRGPAPASVSQFTCSRPLSCERLSSTVQSILRAAGYAGSPGYSLRNGAAITAASRRVPDHLIKTLGQWSSDAYQIYIRTPVSSVMRVSSQLA